MNKRKVPKIRFKGFYDDWEQRKFGDVFMSLQNNTLSRAELNDEFGAAQSIHYGDVLIKYDEVLDVSKESLSYIEKQSIADKFKTSYLQNGDVIIADTAEDETVGKCTEIEGLTNQKVISGLHTMPVRSNRKFASGFLGFYLNSTAYHDQLKPLMQGIKVTSISKGTMQDTVVKFPLDLKEQEQIGIYFSGIDHLITLHQRKLEKLKIIKKSMLENCFPKNGEKAPKIRFSGFSDDWEQRKVYEMFKVTRGYVLPATDTSEEISDEMPYPVYSSQTKDNGLMGYYRDYLYEDAITWTTDGANAGTVNFRDGKFYCTNVCGVLLSDKIEANKAIAEALNNVAKKYVSYVGNPKLMNNVMVDIQITIPTSREERNHISSYFSNLDHLITLHQSKLEKLKMIKKSMLETMFV